MRDTSGSSSSSTSAPPIAVHSSFANDFSAVLNRIRSENEDAVNILFESEPSESILDHHSDATDRRPLSSLRFAAQSLVHDIRGSLSESRQLLNRSFVRCEESMNETSSQRDSSKSVPSKPLPKSSLRAAQKSKDSKTPGKVPLYRKGQEKYGVQDASPGDVSDKVSPILSLPVHNLTWCAVCPEYLTLPRYESAFENDVMGDEDMDSAAALSSGVRLESLDDLLSPEALPGDILLWHRMNPHEQDSVSRELLLREIQRRSLSDQSNVRTRALAEAIAQRRQVQQEILESAYRNEQRSLMPSTAVQTVAERAVNTSFEYETGICFSYNKYTIKKIW